MNTFKAYLKKEVKESIRQYRYIVLAVGIILFALLDPIMLKLLPHFIKDQVPADLSALINVTQKYAVNNYLNNLSQIGYLFIIFTLSGTLAEEIFMSKLVFPYSKGCSPSGLVMAKLIHNCIAVCILVFIGFLSNYYYVTLLFKKDPVTIGQMLNAASLVSIYYVFNIVLLTLFSSFFKKGLASGIAVIIINFITLSLENVDYVGKLMPNNLMTSAGIFTFNNTAPAIIFVCSGIIILTILTIYRMNKVEVI